MADHLEAQLASAICRPRATRLIGRFLIDLVDETGYLTGSIEEVADKLVRALARGRGGCCASCRASSRSGVCARTLRECLAIQLAEKATASTRPWRRCSTHLDLLAAATWPALRRPCGVDEEDLAEMIAEIRDLDPKPGLAFGSTPIQPVVPDVLLRAAPDGSWIVELNADTLPRVLVNQSYYSRVSRGARTDADSVFLADALQTANWLTRSLEQRARTILKVATEIVRQQDAFFVLGVAISAPAEPEGHRRRHRHARIDRIAGHRQQVYRDESWPVRAEIFLHGVDRQRRRRRGPFGRGGAPSHPPDDRPGGAGRRPVG